MVYLLKTLKIRRVGHKFVPYYVCVWLFIPFHCSVIFLFMQCLFLQCLAFCVRHCHIVA